MGAKDTVNIAVEAVTIFGSPQWRGDIDCSEFTSGELYIVTNDPGAGAYEPSWELFAVDPQTGQEAGTPAYNGVISPTAPPAQANYDGNLATRLELPSLPGIKYRLYLTSSTTATVTITLIGQA